MKIIEALLKIAMSYVKKDITIQTHGIMWMVNDGVLNGKVIYLL